MGVTLRPGDLVWLDAVIPGEPGEGVSVDQSATGRIARAEVRGSRIWLVFSSWGDPDSETEVDTGIEGTAPCVRYQRDSGRLYLYYGVEGSVKRQYTEDESTFTGMLTIFASGTFPAVWVSPTGVHYVYANNDAGGIKFKGIDRTGGTPTELGEATAISSGVEAGGIAAVGDDRHGKPIHLYYSGGSGIERQESQDGINFS